MWYGDYSIQHFLDNLTKKFINYHKIDNKTDLNTITARGKYIGIWGNNCINKPDSSYNSEFYLEVIEFSGYKVQIFIECVAYTKVYIRGWDFLGDKFGPWRIFSLANIQ